MFAAGRVWRFTEGGGDLRQKGWITWGGYRITVYIYIYTHTHKCIMKLFWYVCKYTYSYIKSNFLQDHMNSHEFT